MISGLLPTILHGTGRALRNLQLHEPRRSWDAPKKSRVSIYYKWRHLTRHRYFMKHLMFPDTLHASAKNVAIVAFATRYAWVVSTLLPWIAILLLTALRRSKCVVHRHHERAGRAERRNRPRHGLLTRLHWNTWSAVIIINSLYNFNF